MLKLRVTKDTHDSLADLQERADLRISPHLRARNYFYDPEPYQRKILGDQLFNRMQALYALGEEIELVVDDSAVEPILEE